MCEGLVLYSLGEGLCEGLVLYSLGEGLCEGLVLYSVGEALRVTFEQTVPLSLAAESLLFKGMNTNMYRTVMFPVV